MKKARCIAFFGIALILIAAAVILVLPPKKDSSLSTPRNAPSEWTDSFRGPTSPPPGPDFKGPSASPSKDAR